MLLLSPPTGWETGRESEPQLLNMNIYSARENTRSKPALCLYQFDLADPMNPLGLLMAYAEQKALRLAFNAENCHFEIRSSRDQALRPD